MQADVEGKIVEVPAGASCADALKMGLSGKRMKAALACRVDGGGIVDLSTPLSSVASAALAALPDRGGVPSLSPVTADLSADGAADTDGAHAEEGLALLRHSVAHIMADAVQQLFPEARVSIGPSIAAGFYYDFEVSRPFTPDDLPNIEERMRAIVAANLPFTRREVSKAEALTIFRDKGESYKVEILQDLDIPDEAPVSLYQCGGFLDLCRGPHIAASGQAGAFKLLSVAGAYWRGDEKRPMLSRIYGTAFADEKALKAHLQRLEEAGKRDHRKLGAALSLFAFHEDVAPGMSFWLPKGMMLRVVLEDFLRREHLKRGYDIVQGPQILRRELWERSGHYDHYRENMYFTEIEDDSHGVKPMNCVGHMLIYGQRLHSYRDLPVRMFELGVVHRHEKSGVLHGLLRVRQFTQDDAHIICAPEQLEDEIIGVMKLSSDLMDLFGFDYRIVVSTRPENSIGSDEDWARATAALIKAVEKEGKAYRLNEGDGAFYGPKIDIKVTDAIGREWQLSTIQVDFTLPERFDLVYVGQDGERHRPVMVHRAILGSLERFIGVLTEHYAGAFPTWLAPVQAVLLNVTDDQLDFTRKACASLAAGGIRAEADTRNEKLGFKVREAQLAKIPYILVVGDREVNDEGVSVRLRSGENAGFRTLSEAVAMIRADSQEPFKRGGMSYSFA